MDTSRRITSMHVSKGRSTLPRASRFEAPVQIAKVLQEQDPVPVDQMRAWLEMSQLEFLHALRRLHAQQRIMLTEDAHGTLWAHSLETASKSQKSSANSR